MESDPMQKPIKDKTVPWKRNESHSSKSFLSNRYDGEMRMSKCRVCGDNHPIWQCEVFKGRPAERRWETAKRLGLCYRCLGRDHLGNACTNYRECNIDGCKDTHHRLLHAQPKGSSGQRSFPHEVDKESKTTETGNKEVVIHPNQTYLAQESASTQVTEGDESESLQVTEGDASTHTATMEITNKPEKVIALQTVPLILKNGNKRIMVNCFLDEGSDTTYINEDLVEELGVRGQKEKIIVNVANDQQVKFMSMTFEVGLESIDGNVNKTIVAKTSQKICGGMKPVNWVKIKHKWTHLRDIPSPELAQRGTIDILLRADNHELMTTMKEVAGYTNKPCARLCSLGWTAIGRIDKDDVSGEYHTGLIRTFRTQRSDETTLHDEGPERDAETVLGARTHWNPTT